MRASRASRATRCGAVFVLLLTGICGCSQESPSLPLDVDVARTSVQKAMQAWVDGKKPNDLQPEIIMGDPTWIQGEKLASFEILTEEETSDGSNLHICVNRKFGTDGDDAESKVTYIVGTSPRITIFPQ